MFNKGFLPNIIGIICLSLCGISSIFAQDKLGIQAKVLIVEEECKKGVSGATIDISDSERNRVGLFSTDDKGVISFYAPIKGEYTFLVRAKGYRIKKVKRAILEDGDSFEIAIARQSTEEGANSKKESSAQGIVIGRNNEEEKKELVATEKRNYEYKITGSVVEINKRNKTIPLSLSKIYLTTNGPRLAEPSHLTTDASPYQHQLANTKC